MGTDPGVGLLQRVWPGSPVASVARPWIVRERRIRRPEQDGVIRSRSHCLAGLSNQKRKERGSMTLSNRTASLTRVATPPVQMRTF